MSSPVPDGRAPRRWGVRRWLLLVLAVGLAAGFQWAVVVGSPPKSGPSGVDGLTIPQTVLHPDEFVEQVTNEWLPLSPGAEWVRVGEVDGRSVEETTTVLAERVEVGGIAATQVRTEAVVDGRASRESQDATVVRLYAQDRAGHVWLIGRLGEWTVDDAGAVAGLAMPASPRRGDGWVREVREGQLLERVRVGERGLAITTPAGRFEGLQGFTESVSDAAGDTTNVEVEVAGGVGEITRTWGSNSLTLQSHQPGD